MLDIQRKKILQVNIDNTGGNGAFSLIMYLYGYLKKDFIFDYFTMGRFTKNSVYSEIVDAGGKCFSANLRKNKLIGHIKLPFVFFNYLKQNHYEIVHIHSEVAYKHFLYAVAARFAGVKKIIIHSHSCNIDGNNKGIKYICHIVLRSIVNKLGTDYLACSEPAATWMFKKQILNSDRFRYLHNGIAPKAYKFSAQKRSEKRKELGVSSNIVLGHVGALKKVKNQERLLDIVKSINNSQYKLLLIGDGKDRSKLENKAKLLGIEEQIIFLGNRTDVADVLQAIDVFVFPSIFEGIPMALIEVQATGVPIVASDSINKAIKINNNIRFVSLEKNNLFWIKAIIEAQNNNLGVIGYKNVSLSKYNIENSAKELSLLYKKF